ncbi:TPA: DUF1080 domain-containing protein, partial [Candidatus Poribacteria bacterium]|nr:DUF1080 domain-containing protein [Candidatus Poribacteria bacterium]
MSRFTKTFSGNFAMVVGVIALLVALLLAPLPMDASQPEVLPMGDSQDGWVSLFDGTSHASWRGYRKDTFPDQGWKMDDGWLQVTAGGGGGDIVTVDQYDDFELEL